MGVGAALAAPLSRTRATAPETMLHRNLRYRQRMLQHPGSRHHASAHPAIMLSPLAMNQPPSQPGSTHLQTAGSSGCGEVKRRRKVE